MAEWLGEETRVNEESQETGATERMARFKGLYYLVFGGGGVKLTKARSPWRRGGDAVTG